jgi:hypothetical protein
MITVPKGKKICIGRHRFLEGEVIPPHFMVELPVKASPKKRGPYKPRAKSEPVAAEAAEE